MLNNVVYYMDFLRYVHLNSIRESSNLIRHLILLLQKVSHMSPSSGLVHRLTCCIILSAGFIIFTDVFSTSVLLGLGGCGCL